jgi:hemerythrin-like domain-containing protein
MTAIRDLTYEHALIGRLMMIYEKIIFDFKASNKVNIKLVQHLAKKIRFFVEENHEMIEEEHVFPFLIKQNVDIKEINELIRQHRIGRAITSILMIENDVNIIIKNMIEFVKIYRFHALFEDSIILDHFDKRLNDVEKKNYEELFEKLEPPGTDKLLKDIIRIEKYLKINDLFKPEKQITIII